MKGKDTDKLVDILCKDLLFFFFWMVTEIRHRSKDYDKVGFVFTMTSHFIPVGCRRRGKKNGKIYLCPYFFHSCAPMRKSKTLIK